MKAGEIIRIIVLSLIVAGLMFWIQPQIYQLKIIRISDVPMNPWLRNDYTTGAWIVFGCSLLATLIWYFLTAKAKVIGTLDTLRWQVIWWLLGFLPILGICIALYFFNRSQDALLSLTGFYIVDAIFLLFWLPTATSSPGSFKHIPPGAFLLRRLIGS